VAELRVQHETVGDAVIARVHGELDMLTASDLLAQLDRAADLARPGPIVVADLAGVSFLGSAGLSTLLEINERCRQRGIALWIVAAKPVAQRPLRVTGLDRILNVTDSLSRIVQSA
jgi:anti-sigma B factor antagonist